MRRNFPLLVFCAYNMVQPAHAAQAIPNTLVTLSSPVIRVADLFSSAGPEADIVLGSAPPPGERIVVGAEQLAAIAAAYQVPWQPDGSEPEVVLASPGSAIPPALISNAIAAAVAAAGGPTNAAVTLPDFAPPMVPTGATPAVTVTRMDFDPVSQQFSTSLVIDATGMAPQNLDLAGLAQPSVEALVASHDLLPGEVLDASDVTLAQLPASLTANAISSVDDAIGMSVKSGVQAGQAVTPDNLDQPILVRKGAFVLLNLNTPGMVLTAQGVALGAGGNGSLIPVLNPASHAVVQAVITGPGSASIAPGSAPLSAAENTNGYAGYGSYAQAHSGNAEAMVQP
jgi:flagella basal body P-ring formation protein FlgA